MIIYKKSSGKTFDSSGAITGLIYIYFSLQPQILLNYISSIYCIKVMQKSYVFSHMAYTCDDNSNH